MGAMALGAWTLASSAEALGAPAQGAATAPASQPRARAVIQLWMAGGPCHIDTFDPKPGAGDGFTGPFRKPLQTNVRDIQIGPLLPQLAKQADKFSIIRSMTHGNNAHETSTYILQTGTLPSADLVYPSAGAVVAYKRKVEGGYGGALPPYVTLTRPLGRFSEEGFLGAGYRTFATGGDPAGKVFVVEGLSAPKPGSDVRAQARRALLEALDQPSHEGDVPGAEMEAEPVRIVRYQKTAFELVGSDAAKAFDLSEEPESLRNRYGRNAFGQSCLLARRLVERGVPYVTVNFGGWDTHKDHFPAMQRQLPVLDAGFAALLEDLASRGLLSTTIVTWFGEFGRTPRVQWEPPWNGGRHHWGAAFSAVVAGGGFQGGRVLGATDARGEAVKDRPVYPWDLTATIYQQLGIDPAGHLPHPQGCVAYVTPQATGSVPTSGGVLKELL